MRLHGRFIIQISILGFVLIDYVRSNKYTNTWALHIEGGEAVARSLARKHGFIYVDQVRKKKGKFYSVSIIFYYFPTMFSNLIKRFIPSTTHIYLMILSNDQIIKIYLLCTLKKK